MRAYELTSAAETDLTEILLYLADEAGEATALQHLDRFSAAFEMLGKHPAVGHRRADSKRPVLFWSVGSYVIAYKPRTSPTRIIAVLHGARDFSVLLIDRE